MKNCIMCGAPSREGICPDCLDELSSTTDHRALERLINRAVRKPPRKFKRKYRDDTEDDLEVE